ncbi:MAG TPA: cytochrome c [Thermoanaerobaculia bacterium]|nr:cytochrome c [Thermoanaerobaculia bacterium]
MKRAPARGAALALLALLAPPFAGCSQHARDAGDVYRTQCARCHGADGTGDRRSVGLYPELDLTASQMVRAGSRARGLLYRRISEGYGAMPGFADRLETAEIQSLVDYILRLPQGKAGR